MEPFTITRTNTKRYVGSCGLCDFHTDVISVRANCALRLRTHCITEHGVHPTSLNQYLEPPNYRRGRKMKNPKKELPPLEKFAEYVDHLCVFAAVEEGATKGQYGMSVADCLVWVYNKGAWKALGKTPIFWQTVGRQLMEEIGPDTDDKDESLGAFLRKGGHPTEKGDNFFWLDIAQDTQDTTLLKEWEKNHSDAF